MSYQVRTERRPAPVGLDGSVFVLEDSAGDNRVEVLPALGFNCFRWQVRWQSRPLELLYAAPNLFEEPRPTRSGIPVLFPFPNRIRDGRFAWKGKAYDLPANDPAAKNAIHGFACRHPWRVHDYGADGASAWVSAEFWGAKDAPESLELWPADFRIRLTVRLGNRRLRLEAEVDNPANTPLPFGLGYHPYFRVPLIPGGKVDQCLVQVDASSYWELKDNLPTGDRSPVDAARDLTKPRPYTELQLDDMLAADKPKQPTASPGALLPQGRLRQLLEKVELRVAAARDFREIVVFTPPHRQAFCLEPYTCTTDAINLQQRGLDAGLLVLQPEDRWTAVVEMEVADS